MAETSTTVPITAVTDGYFAMWSEPDPARRQAIIAATWSEDATYVDPMFTADGYPGLDALVRGVHERFPGHRFTLVGPVDTHHDRARWAWQFGLDGAEPMAAGVDYAELAPDGRLRAVTGFFDRVASA